jgi:hypothetical protein
MAALIGQPSFFYLSRSISGDAQHKIANKSIKKFDNSEVRVTFASLMALLLNY